MDAKPFKKPFEVLGARIAEDCSQKWFVVRAGGAKEAGPFGRYAPAQNHCTLLNRTARLEFLRKQGGDP